MEGPSRAICSVAIPSTSQRHSLTPEASATNKRAVDFLVFVVNPAVEVPGSAGMHQYCCKRSLKTVRGLIQARECNSRHYLLRWQP